MRSEVSFPINLVKTANRKFHYVTNGSAQKIIMVTKHQSDNAIPITTASNIAMSTSDSTECLISNIHSEASSLPILPVDDGTKILP